MTAPISVDPHALAATGTAVGGEGDAIAAAVGTLDGGLSGDGASFGHDAAGVVFGQRYTASGNALLHAAASAVNACRRLGFGIQMSAANYGHANASSTVGGGTSPVPVPTAPGEYAAPNMPPLLGNGIAAPLGWVLVESFVGDVWPDGSPGEMRAAATAWRSFGSAFNRLAGQVDAKSPELSSQQIPEAGQMAQGVGKVGSGLAEIAAEALTLATAVDGFAGTVEASQNAVRDLLHQLSPTGVLETIGEIFTGLDPMDKVKQIAREIKTVLDNMKREADATGELFTQGINMLDSASVSLEAWADKQFTKAFGHDVGTALSAAFNWQVDGSEGALKFVAETAQGISQLDPTRFAYDPSGAAKTWEGMLESTAVMTNPALLASTIATDPQGSLDTVKSVVDWKDVEAGHPGRAVGYNVAQIGSLFIPGVGEAGPAVEGAGVAGRAAATEERAAAVAARDAVPGLTRASSVSEGIAAEAGRVGSELDGIKVTEGAAPGAAAPVERPPVDAAPPPAESPRPEPSSGGVPDSGSGSQPHVLEQHSAPAPDSAQPRAAASSTPSSYAPVQVPTDPPFSGLPGAESHHAEVVPQASPPLGSHSPMASSDVGRSVDVEGASQPGHIAQPLPPEPTTTSAGPSDAHQAPGPSRPVWSDNGQAPHSTPDLDTSHAGSTEPDVHHAGSVEDGAGPDGRVKFSGHGSYSSADGITVIPEGSSVTVYAEHGSTITDALGNLIETGGDTSRVYSHTYVSGETIPNYTLHPPDGLDIQGNPWTVDASIRLSEMLTESMGEIDFAACLYDPALPTNLVYDSHGIWDETQGQLTHVYESPAAEGAWDDVVSEAGPADEQANSQPYYDATQNLYGQATDWDYSDVGPDGF